jgi:hypothetical protein
VSSGGTSGMDRQKFLAIFFALLMAMWMIATAATLI